MSFSGHGDASLRFLPVVACLDSKEALCTHVLPLHGRAAARRRLWASDYEANIIKKKTNYWVVLFHILRVKYEIKIPNMSCLKSTTYWVSLFHILHVKYGIKRPNSLSFFFIILASGVCCSGRNPPATLDTSSGCRRTVGCRIS